MAYADDFLIVAHLHVPEAGVYSVEIARVVTEIVDVETLVAPEPPDPELLEDPDFTPPAPELVMVPTAVTYTTDYETIYFADHDPHWFEGDERRPDEDIVAEQRSIVRDALNARELSPPEAPTAAIPLPGAGDAL
ncbi:MAG: hypothetical protein ABW167_19540 [Baekduia sp.]